MRAEVPAVVDGIDDRDHEMSTDAIRLAAERHRRRHNADEKFSRLAPDLAYEPAR